MCYAFMQEATLFGIRTIDGAERLLGMHCYTRWLFLPLFLTWLLRAYDLIQMHWNDIDLSDFLMSQDGIYFL